MGIERDQGMGLQLTIVWLLCTPVCISGEEDDGEG